MAKDGVVQAGSVVGGRGAAPDPARGKPPETPAPFPFRSWLPERSSPSRVRCAAPDRRALDRSGPFQALHLEKGKGANAKGSLPASRWSALTSSFNRPSLRTVFLLDGEGLLMEAATVRESATPSPFQQRTRRRMRTGFRRCV